MKTSKAGNSVLSLPGWGIVTGFKDKFGKWTTCTNATNGKPEYGQKFATQTQAMRYAEALLPIKPPEPAPIMGAVWGDAHCPHCGCSLKVRLEADDPSLTASDPDPVETSAIPF